MAEHGPVRVFGRDRKFSGFINVDEITYEYRRLDGTPSGLKKRLVMERGDAAAILLHNVDQQSVVLVRQPRIAAYTETRPDDTWLLELPAGVIEAKHPSDPSRPETAEGCARREAYEETGYRVGACQPIATIFPSAGASSERIHIFYAEVGSNDYDPTYRLKQGDQIDDDVEVVHVRLHDLLHMVDGGQIHDAKLLVAGQWLRHKPPRENKTLEPGEICYAWAEDLEEGRARRRGPRVIGIQTGGLDDMENIDIWVNPENTDMQMARIIDVGISARIRLLGAAKHRNGTMYADTIADALKRKLAGQVAVRPGTVVVTTSGDLRYTHDVKYVMHVACAQHTPGASTVHVDPAAAADGLRRALLEAEYRSQVLWRRALFGSVRSMLVPLIGTGNAGGDPVKIATAMVPVAIKHFEMHPSSRFRKLFFIAYKESEREIIAAALRPFIKTAAGGILALDNTHGVRKRKRQLKAAPQDQRPQPDTAGPPPNPTGPRPTAPRPA